MDCMRIFTSRNAHMGTFWSDHQSIVGPIKRPGPLNSHFGRRQFPLPVVYANDKVRIFFSLIGTLYHIFLYRVIGICLYEPHQWYRSELCQLRYSLYDQAYGEINSLQSKIRGLSIFSRSNFQFVGLHCGAKLFQPGNSLKSVTLTQGVRTQDSRANVL